jgi:hypothetical protein
MPVQRTHVYLTDTQSRGLRALAAETGTSQAELIRQAVDDLLAARKGVDRQRTLDDAFGLWSDAPDLDKRMAQIRGEFDANIPDR